MPCTFAETDGVERFFTGCPSGMRIRVHREARFYDLHAVLYTSANLMELEVIRLADWLIDLPLPGAEVRPLEHAVKGIQVAYHRLGSHRVASRVGELVDALQLRELSLGDAAVTYTVATGGVVSPGSGTVVRFNKLLDWIQHVMGDLNELGGRLLGQPRGLIRSRLPGILLDGFQGVVVHAFHGLTMMGARLLDRSVVGIETTIDGLLNAPRASPHRRTTVFLRMPTDVYRAHELWALTFRKRVYVGTVEELATLSHADLFHPRRRDRRVRWWMLERFAIKPTHVVVVTDQRTFAKAPTTLVPYVVPAEWVLQDPEELNHGSNVDNSPAIF